MADKSIDMFDTPVAVGDYVVSYNHIYKIEVVDKYGVSGRIQSNAKTRPRKRMYRYEIVKLTPDQVAIVEQRMHNINLASNL